MEAENNKGYMMNQIGVDKMDKLSIGWAEENITPNGKVSLVGQFAERISEYVEKPLCATAMAVQCGSEQAIFCSVDLINVSWMLIDSVLEKVSKLSDEIDTNKVIISAIHTHTGPGYSGRGVNAAAKITNDTVGATSASTRLLLEKYLPKGKKYVKATKIEGNRDVLTDEQVSNVLIEKISKCIVDAWNRRQKAGFSNAFGRAAVGMCRRATYTDGSAKMWGDTNRAVFEAIEGGSDTGIELMYVFDENKKLTGIVANLACPAQCVQHRLFVSPDFWGEAKKLLREHFGEDIFLLTLCSAAGDQCPVDLVRWVEPESDVNDPNIERLHPLKRKADPSMFDLAGMKKVGRRVAAEIIGVYNDGLGQMQTEVEFEHRVVKMELPLRRATLADENNAVREIRDYLNRKDGDVDFNDAAKLQVHLGILKRIELQDVVNTIPINCHILKLGSVAIATNPFELFLDYGNKIKARSHAEQTFLIQLADGSEGYLPTEKAEEGGHYSAFISSGSVGHIGGDMLVSQTLKNINEMF